MNNTPPSPVPIGSSPAAAGAAQDARLKTILKRTHVIACVGLSVNPLRPSYFVARYLFERGYKIIPVNPAYAGKTLFNAEVVPCFSAIAQPQKVDMVDIFRRPEAVPQIAQDAHEYLPNLSTLWMQIGAAHPQTATQARAWGIDTVEGMCPKIEHQRLFGDLRKAGFNTGVISSKL